MKIGKTDIPLILFCILLCGLVNSLYSQEVDTIKSHDGSYIIIDKTDNKRLNDEIAQRGGTMFLANYKEYDQFNNLLKESVYVNHEGETEYQLIKDSEHKSTWEIIWTGDLQISTSRNWYESGNLEFEILSSHDFIEERSYYDTQENKLWIFQRSAVKPVAEYDSIIIENFIEGSYLVEEKIDTSVMLWDFQIEYHDNGRIKEIGSFSRRKFLEFRSKKFYEEWKETGKEEFFLINDMAVIISKNPKVKDGKWLTFDQNGNLIEEINYHDGTVQ